LVGIGALLGALALLGVLLFRDLYPPPGPAASLTNAASPSTEKSAGRPTPATRPSADAGLLDDFRSGLREWEVEHATADRGVVRFQGPPAKFGVIRRKVSGYAGDFTVSADFTQLGEKGGDWNQVLDLYFGDAHLYLKDKGKYNRWIITANADRRVDKAFWYSVPGSAGGTVALVGVRQTFQVRRVGVRFTFAVIQEGTAYRIDEHDLPELGALTEVGVRSWTYGAPQNHSTVENFRLIKGSGRLRD
jgi:hypothetical protein